MVGPTACAKYPFVRSNQEPSPSALSRSLPPDIDVVTPVWIREGVHVDFHRTEKLFRRLGDLAVNRLAANNHEFVEAHCVGCSPDA